MTATLGLLDLEEAAKEAAGNWQHFDCFCWHRKTDLERPEEWAIFYTHHRDSELLDQSNAEVIAETMEKFTKGNNPDVVFESHHHWAGRARRWVLCSGLSSWPNHSGLSDLL